MAGRQILFVADSLALGGAERVMLDIAAGLVDRSEMVCIAVSAAGPLGIEAARVGVDVVVLGAGLVKRRTDERFTAALGELIRARRPHLVHTHMYASTVAACSALGDDRAALIVHEHSEAGWRDAAARALAREAYRRADAIIAVSEAIATRLRRVDQVHPRKVRVVANVLPRSTPHLSGRKVPNWYTNTIGIVARLTPEKGVDVFVAAAAEVSRRLPHVHAVVVGDGPDADRLHRLAAELAAPVQFLGMRPDGARLISGFDVAVVSSFTEGTPLVVLEAMAAGVPLVSTAVGGIPTQVSHEVEALLVPPRDVTALAQACIRLLVDRSLAQRLARAANRRWQLQPSREAQLCAIENIYQEAIFAKGTASQP